MDLKRQFKNPFFQQYLLEILLPLVGFFFFGWSVLIIAVFYLIDQFAGEVSFYRKLLAIQKHAGKMTLTYIVLSILAFVIILSAEGLALYCYFTESSSMTKANFFEELRTFAREEFWLMFPLVMLLYYMKDQFTFFMPRKFLKRNTLQFFAWRLIANTTIGVITILGFAIAQKFPLSDIGLISGFLLIKIAYDFSVGKWIEKKALEI